MDVATVYRQTVGGGRGVRAAQLRPVVAGSCSVALVSPLFKLFTDISWIGKYQALIIPDISFALP